MKSFVIWLGIALATFGTGAGAYHSYLENDPRLVLVIVDSAFEMRKALDSAKSKALQLATHPYSKVALYTERARVHGWADSVSPARISAYGPRNFERLTTGALGPEFAEADIVHFVTNAPAAQLANLPSHWQVHQPR